MKDNENVSFEELLASLNEAIEGNSKQLQDAPEESGLEKTVIMKPPISFASTDQNNFKSIFYSEGKLV